MDSEQNPQAGRPDARQQGRDKLRLDGEKSRPAAVILLSGGLDSTTVLAIARANGYECFCLSFAYGQRQQAELVQARANARQYEAREHLILNLELDRIGGSALTGGTSVPKDRDFAEMSRSVPVTYVPARNSIFLAYAVAWAEVIGANDVFIGANVMDYSGYPDCRPEFLAAFEKMANLGTRAGAEEGRRFVIHAPLLHMNKAEIIAAGLRLGVDYGQTHSCYDPDEKGRPCGGCDACRLRRKGFAELGLADPLAYQTELGTELRPERGE